MTQKNKKGFMRFGRLCVLAVMTASTLLSAGCYDPGHGYEADNPGELPAPIAGFDYDAERLKPYDEEITITVAAIDYPLESDVKIGTTPRNQSFNKIVKDVLNINLQYTVVSTTDNYDTKLNLAIAGGDTPDMFYTTNSNLYADLKENGALADLGNVFWYLNEELQDVYLNVMPELLPNVMKDGKLYAFPMAGNKYESAQRLYIRKDWLDIVGAEAPTTIDDMIAVGELFVQNEATLKSRTGVSKIIPLGFHKDITWTGTASASGLMQAHGASPDAYFLGEDGKLHSSNTSQEMKNALTTMNTMYKKKIIDQEFTSKNVDMVYDNIAAGQVGMVFGQWYMPNDVLGRTITNVPGSDWVSVELPTYNGVKALPIVKRVNLTGYNLVSKDCKYPEAAAKIINLFYDVYYNDNAEEIYGPNVKPENGFYYNMVPIKLWNSIASIQEFERVNKVFKDAYDAGMRVEYDASGKMLASSWTVKTSEEVAALDQEAKDAYNAQLAIYNRMKTREKKLHWDTGYPYYCAMRKGTDISSMNATERGGWGIYSCMVDDNGGYRQVVDLTYGTTQAKYDEFYGTALTSMTEYSGYIFTTLSGTAWMQMITGNKPMSYFDDYVKEYNKNGGDTIHEQVNEWYKARPKNDAE